MNGVVKQFDLIETMGCQRWNKRRDLYRPAGEPIDTEKYGVDLVQESEARDFVAKHHYAGSLPPTRVRVGLFRSSPFRQTELVGVAVFSVPVQAKALECYFGVDNDGGVELGRLVLLDSVEANGETFFVSRACRMLKKELPGVRAVLSYSDPMERVNECGEVVKRGHFGTVYRGLSATYMGRSSKRTLVLDKRGRVISERSLSKLKNDESGAGGAYRMLREAGAPERLFGESGKDYVERAVREGPFVRMKHPGNLVFGWGVGSKTERSLVRRSMVGMAYPPYPQEAMKLAA